MARSPWGPSLPSRRAAPTGTLAAQDAFLPVEIDDDENRLRLTIPEDLLGQDVLYMNTLATGLGLSSPDSPADRWGWRPSSASNDGDSACS